MGKGRGKSGAREEQNMAKKVTGNTGKAKEEKGRKGRRGIDKAREG